MKILVVGATGQLGARIVEKLRVSDHEVTALHRPRSNMHHLLALGGISFRVGDLMDPSTMVDAVTGMDVVICTVNSAAPRKSSDTFEKVDKQGVSDLIRAAAAAGVGQFIYTSAYSYGELDRRIPIAAAKRHCEEALRSAGMPYTIFQPTAFMDVAFAFLGTDLPLVGEQAPTVGRPFKFANNFFRGIRNDIAGKGRINILGKGATRQSYIAIDDVAEFHVKAIGHTSALNQTIPIGGPEALSGMDLKALFEELYQRPLKVKTTPAPVLYILSRILRFFNMHAANIMALNHAAATRDSIVDDAQATADKFGVKLTSAMAYLQRKKTLAERAQPE